MKRYLVLAGDDYYPNGWSDYRGSYESLEEAISKAESVTACDWYDIIDSVTEKVVVSGTYD